MCNWRIYWTPINFHEAYQFFLLILPWSPRLTSISSFWFLKWCFPSSAGKWFQPVLKEDRVKENIYNNSLWRFSDMNLLIGKYLCINYVIGINLFQNVDNNCRNPLHHLLPFKKGLVREISRFRISRKKKQWQYWPS